MDAFGHRGVLKERIMKIVLEKVCPLFGLKKILKTGEVVERKVLDVTLLSKNQVRVGDHVLTVEDPTMDGIREAISKAVPGVVFRLEE